MRKLILLAALLLPTSASAKDLRNRFGVGFNNQFSSVSSLSIKYGFPTGQPTVNFQAELNAGGSFLDGQADAWFFGGRLLYAVLAEDNMNLYLAGGVGFVAASDTQALRLQPAMGVEFFLFGLENLGLTAEWGVNVDIGTSTGIQTLSGGPAVGAHYYF